MAHVSGEIAVRDFEVERVSDPAWLGSNKMEIIVPDPARSGEMETSSRILLLIFS